jgi:hypothetical protein
MLNSYHNANIVAGSALEVSSELSLPVHEPCQDLMAL